ncbi:MAG TPA: hypothetical protein VJU83_09105 [Burkholderiales bacterium]|nr:hypothetical protein [Burkholderiales bacterium]
MAESAFEIRTPLGELGRFQTAKLIAYAGNPDKADASGAAVKRMSRRFDRIDILKSDGLADALYELLTKADRAPSKFWNKIGISLHPREAGEHRFVHHLIDAFIH